MCPTVSRRTWAVLGASVTGALHRRAGVPNQDAALYRLLSDDAASAVLAVSDGHGSPKCFRSHIGSQLAVEVAVAELTAFCEASGGQRAEATESLARQTLPRAIVQRWRERVLGDYAAQPFREEELSRLERAARSAVERTAADNRPYVAYGATLLAALVTPAFVFYLQLGDGEVLVVESENEVVRPIESDAALIANETTSLCQELAMEEVRIGFRSLAESSPGLILLATDGYPNSFETPEGFLQVASDLRRAIDSEGIVAVGAALPGWLEEASQLGSGDDISVAMLCCADRPSAKADISQNVLAPNGRAEDSTPTTVHIEERV